MIDANGATPSLDRWWESFERRVLDRNHATRRQRRDMRRAFYCGAGVMMKFLVDELPTLDEAEFGRALESLQDELLAFFRELRAGRT